MLLIYIYIYYNTKGKNGEVFEKDILIFLCSSACFHLLLTYAHVVAHDYTGITSVCHILSAECAIVKVSGLELLSC